MTTWDWFWETTTAWIKRLVYREQNPCPCLVFPRTTWSKLWDEVFVCWFVFCLFGEEWHSRHTRDTFCSQQSLAPKAGPALVSHGLPKSGITSLSPKRGTWEVCGSPPHPPPPPWRIWISYFALWNQGDSWGRGLELVLWWVLFSEGLFCILKVFTIFSFLLEPPMVSTTRHQFSTYSINHDASIFFFLSFHLSMNSSLGITRLALSMASWLLKLY